MKHKRYLYFTIVILFALLAAVGLVQAFARQAQNTDTDWQQVNNNGQVWRDESTYQIFLPGIMNKYIPPSTGTWRVYDSPTSKSLQSVSMVSSNDGWAGGYDGALLHYDGNEWTEFPNQSTINIQAISMSSSDNGWAVGYYNDSNQKLVLRWDGNSWNHVVIPSNFRFAQDLSTPDAVSAFFVGATLICDPDCDDIGGLINWWNGSGWVQYNTMDTHLAHWAVSMVSAADGWSVGQEKLLPSGTTRGLILRWNGNEWKQVSHPDVGLLAEVDASDAANAWAMGYYGELLHWDGINWTSVASPVSTRMYSLSIVDAGDAWAVGSESIIHWDGNEWTQASNPTSDWLYSVSMVSRNDGWAVGYNGTILKFGP